jgi:hypothetical protein
LKFLFFSSLTHLYLSSPFDKNGDFLKIENSVLSGAKLDGCVAALLFTGTFGFFLRIIIVFFFFFYFL